MLRSPEDCIDIVGLVAGWRFGGRVNRVWQEKKINRFVRDSNGGFNHLHGSREGGQAG